MTGAGRLARVGLPLGGLVVGGLLVTVAPAAAQESYYHKPSDAVVRILEAPPLPTVWLSPARDVLLFAPWEGYPPLADLAAPKLKLAGMRVNPVTNGPQRAPYWTGLTVKRLADNTEHRVALPDSARIGSPWWSADGKWAAFTNTAKESLELWVLDVARASARRIPGVRLNGSLGTGYSWMPDQKTLLVRLVPPNRGAPHPGSTASEARMSAATCSRPRTTKTCSTTT